MEIPSSIGSGAILGVLAGKVLERYGRIESNTVRDASLGAAIALLMDKLEAEAKEDVSIDTLRAPPTHGTPIIPPEYMV